MMHSLRSLEAKDKDIRKIKISPDGIQCTYLNLRTYVVPMQWSAPTVRTGLLLFFHMLQGTRIRAVLRCRERGSRSGPMEGGFFWGK